MMKKYPKVKHSHRKDVIWEKFEMKELITLQEKIDGKNFRIGIEQVQDKDGETFRSNYGSRTQDDTDDKFNSKVYKKAINHIDYMMSDVIPFEVWEELFSGLNKYTGRQIDQIVIFAEFLGKPRESTLYYETTPLNHLAVFDISIFSGNEYTMISPDSSDYILISNLLGIDIVPLLYAGESRVAMQDLFAWARKEITEESYLGKQKREGVVFKNYSWYEDGTRFQDEEEKSKLHMVKFVREEFVESLSGAIDKDKSLKSKLDEVTPIVEYIMKTYVTKGRLHKAIMRLEEVHGRGKIDRQFTGSVISEVFNDILAEEKPQVDKLLLSAFKRKMKKWAPLIVQLFQEVQEEEMFKNGLEV